jgi:DNA polymerase delta subunit 1
MLMRENKINVDGVDTPIEFQIVSWYTCDYDYTNDDDDTEFNDECDESDRYLVKVFGVTEAGQSIALNILNFTPFFYIKVNHRVDRLIIERFREFMVSSLPSNLRSSLVNVKVMKKKDFWGFHNNELFTFLRFTFKNLKGYKAGIRIFEKEIKIIGFHSQKKRYKLYESNIDPFLRLIHLRNIEPASWIHVESYEQNKQILPSKCQFDINVDWRKIRKADIEKIAPMLVASFDIECVSSHGDFPVARKDYKKVAYEFFQLYEKKKNSVDELKDYMCQELLAIFDKNGNGELSKVFVKEELTEDTLTKIRFKIKRDIDDIINIASGKLVYDKSVKSNTIGPSKDDIMKKLTEKFGCYETIFDPKTRKNITNWIGMFPKLEGDPIIQIGTTVHKYGEKECCYKHVVSLGSCDIIEGVDVETCETERELILIWCNLINKLDPDIMTGYNIFGFDMSYMYERAIELGVQTQFCKIGRIADYVSQYQEKTLSSSALGDNILKFVDMEGRVIIDVMKVVQRDHKLDSYKLDNVANHFMGMNKHDVSPNDIFRLFKGTSADRKIVADYCIQDCALCNHLMMKLEILANNIGMANVCNVPLSYIFMRGQGIKIFSLVAKQCKEDDFVIPTVTKSKFYTSTEEEEHEDEEGYEGAIVLEPKTGIYTEDPVSVLDYASLYPSSMISENLSHDCYVEIGGKYDRLPNVDYLDISYDIYEKVNDKKVKIGEKICRFVQNEKGVIPRILMGLIKQRKETRKKIEYQTVTTMSGDKLTGLYSEKDDIVILKTIDGKEYSCSKNEVVSKEDTYDAFTKAVLDGLQLAYKITANSLYGQIGAKTSPIYLKEIAACTTATGRNLILKAKDFLEQNYEGVNIVYGDTDSLFISFPMTYTENGMVQKRTGKDAIQHAINMGIEASSKFKKFLKPPHDLEYEKTFHPFILISKKRYCAMKYEHDPTKCKFNSMGIALKRRDNAPIVKTIYGGVIDIIMKKQDINESINFLTTSIQQFIDGKFPLEDLIISKSLRADYKDPTRIAHKALAERMGERDPGNKPQVNDRIPYVYVEISEKNKKALGKQKILQGDRIEHPDYIRKNKLQPDYEFYITNQIMKPVSQIYALVLEQLPSFRKGTEYYKNLEKKLIVEKDGDMKKVKERLGNLREAEVQELLFKQFLIKLENKRKGNREITDWFRKT